MTDTDGSAGQPMEKAGKTAGHLGAILGLAIAGISAAVAVLGFFYPFGNMHLAAFLRSEVRTKFPVNATDLAI